MVGGELRDVSHRVLFVLAVGRKVSQVGNASDETAVVLSRSTVAQYQILYMRSSLSSGMTAARSEAATQPAIHIRGLARVTI
jgi:hypothetical protein